MIVTSFWNKYCSTADDFFNAKHFLQMFTRAEPQPEVKSNEKLLLALL